MIAKVDESKETDYEKKEQNRKTAAPDPSYIGRPTKYEEVHLLKQGQVRW